MNAKTAAVSPKLAVDNDTTATPQKITRWKDGKASIRLSRPLETLSGRKTVLELTEPDAGTLIDFGLPYKEIAGNFGADGKPTSYSQEYDAKKMLQYMCVMIDDVDENILRAMAPRDMKDVFDLVFSLIEAEEAGNS